tara:strand:- start:374 stop:712 length:339 start_codon:yes stop_codon:yes gene_type:complete
MMKHEAIYALYSNVYRIVDSDTGPIAYDSNGNVVSWDDSSVSTKESELIVSDNLEQLRTERNNRLAETDWVVTMHKELGTNIPAAWKKYRQELRDITKDYTSLDDVVWPEKP